MSKTPRIDAIAFRFVGEIPEGEECVQYNDLLDEARKIEKELFIANKIALSAAGQVIQHADAIRGLQATVKGFMDFYEKLAFRAKSHAIVSTGRLTQEQVNAAKADRRWFGLDGLEFVLHELPHQETP